MFTIHAIQTGGFVMLSEKDFSELLMKARKIEPIEVIETQSEVVETQKDCQGGRYLPEIRLAPAPDTYSFKLGACSGWELGASLRAKAC